MNGNKISDKNNIGLFGNRERGKKNPALLLVLCPAQPWRPLPLPFTGGLDGSWWTFPGNFSTFDSPSGFLSVQILGFAPKCAFFSLQSASLTISSTLRSKQGRDFGFTPRWASGAPGKPLSSLFLRFFLNPGGFFLWGLRVHLFPADPGSGAGPALPLQARSSCSFFSNESASAAPSARPSRGLWDI